MTIKPEKRTVSAVKLLRSLPIMTRKEKVALLMKKSKVSQATAYRLVKQQE